MSVNQVHSQLETPVSKRTLREIKNNRIKYSLHENEIFEDDKGVLHRYG